MDFPDKGGSYFPVYEELAIVWALPKVSWERWVLTAENREIVKNFTGSGLGASGIRAENGRISGLGGFG